MSSGVDRGSVLVAGASSQIGVFLLPRLVDAGYRALAISRQAVPSPLVRGDGVSWMQPAQVLTGGERIEKAANRLVSAAPLSLTAKWVQHHPDAEKVVQFSTSSVLTKAQSGDAGERQLMEQILREEDRLKEVCAKRGVPLVILRPTLVYGCGKDRNLSLLWHWGNRTGFIPVARQAEGLRQPVHADDLAALALSALKSDTGTLLESAACGGSTLDYRRMIEVTAACCRRKTRVIALPTGLFTAGIKVYSRIGGGTVNSEMVRRQARDMVFDDSAIRESLAYHPRPFLPDANDFSIPGRAAGFQLPA